MCLSCNQQFTQKRGNTILNPCSPNPCLNGGMCSATNNYSTFSCFCIGHFTGKTENKFHWSYKISFIILKLGAICENPSPVSASNTRYALTIGKSLGNYKNIDFLKSKIREETKVYANR